MDEAKRVSLFQEIEERMDDIRELNESLHAFERDGSHRKSRVPEWGVRLAFSLRRLMPSLNFLLHRERERLGPGVPVQEKMNPRWFAVSYEGEGLFDLIEKLRDQVHQYLPDERVTLDKIRIEPCNDATKLALSYWVTPHLGECRACGCTDESACAGGCYWIDDAHTLCNRCKEAGKG